MAASAPRRIERPYLEQGDGPPVVLVHASNTDHRIWIPHARRMAHRYRVIAPTQRYFGTSVWPDDGRGFSIGTHADELADFIRGLQVRPVTLVGWSYGAAVCLQMAVEQPALVDALVVYEPAIVSFVHAPEDAEAAAADRLDMTALARARVREGDTTSAVRLFMDGVNDRPGSFDGLDEDVQEIMLENGRTLPLLFAAPPPALSCGDLRRLEGRRLVIARGEATRAFYRIAAQWTAACVSRSTLLVVSNARHLLPVEDPETFTSLVLDVLSS
jgi:pimeloyl-ACP methyl ester carboxylesterase